MLTVEHLRRNYLGNLQPWEADVLLEYSSNKPKEFLLTHPEHKLSFAQLGKLLLSLFNFHRGYPMAYITHHKEFFGLDFYVDRTVLMPRPETELLVENVIEILNKKTQEPVLFVDIGTGSGCVPISVFKNIKNENVDFIATDVSRLALMTAEKNARKHKADIIFLSGNLFEPVDQYLSLTQKYSELVIAANLPYGWKSWKNNGSIETKRLSFEPQIALFTGENGLELYRKLLEQLQNIKLPFTALFEFDPRQTEMLSKLVSDHFPSAKIEIKKDLAGRDRLLVFNR